MKSGFRPTVTRVLEPGGFSYKQKAWLRNKNDLIQVFSLDRSPYSEQLYAECGVFVTACLGSNLPIWNQAHLRRRTKIEKGSRLDLLLETPSAYSDEDAFEIITNDLLPKIETFFADLDTVEKVEALTWKGNPNPTASVTRTIMEWFGVPIPEGPKEHIITLNGVRMPN